jgi:hypothetical protein
MKHRIAAVALALTAVLACLALAGCVASRTQTPQEQGPPVVATSTVEATTTAEDTTTPPAETQKTGEITTPKSGSKVRTALMDAARSYLKTDSVFTINQLYVQDDIAVGDITPTTGGSRVYVVWQGPDWEVVWTAKPGTDATKKKVMAAVDGLTDKLADKIDWTKTAPVSESVLKSTLTANARSWAKSLMDGKGQPYAVTELKLAKDSKGRWWATITLQPKETATEAYESIWFWCKYTSGKWSGEAVTGGDERAPGSYFPSDVSSAVGPF